MKNLMILLLLTSAITSAHAQKILTYQLMEPGFNTKVIKGTISEVYMTRRHGKTFWWVCIGKDTIIHVWSRHLDTVTMKTGITRTFTSIKRLDNDWWKKKNRKLILSLRNNLR